MRDLLIGYAIEWEDFLQFLQRIGVYDPVRDASRDPSIASNQDHFHWRYINQYQSGEIGLRESLPICCKPPSCATSFYLLILHSDFFNKEGGRTLIPE